MYLHVIQAYTPAANAFAGVSYSPWINAGLYGEVAFIISKGAGTGTMAITVERADNQNGTNPQRTGFRFSKLIKPPGDVPVDPPRNVASRGIATLSNPEETLMVSINNTIGSKPWLRLVTTELQAEPVCGSVVAVALKGRFGATATAL